MVKNKLTADVRQIALNILASKEKLPGLPIIFVKNDRTMVSEGVRAERFN
jgi:hypothetical protein